MKKTTKMKLQRAGKVWSTIRNRFLKCKLSKVTQAKVFEACVESTMLFNVAVRPFLARDIKSFQNFCDKKYRYIGSDRKGEPLRQMQDYGINMADIRNQLQVSSIRTKVEVALLTRMGHILGLPDESLVKQALLGWLTTLEDKVKSKKKENFNDNTMLEKTNKRGWDGSEYDRTINIKSFKLESKSKEKTTTHGRI